ncbi:NLR family CARD domain-containing protein 3-like [Engraulis encrasicolus]|uniref:NLR family CARD domain-containing protein 3-like n=1 Tax=Engraulis encrasicolus TaxID=184585 RepID=UPI002FD02DDF
MEVPQEGDVQGSPGEGSSPEEDSGHGHVGVHPDPFSMEIQQAHKSHLLERSKCLMEGLTHQGSSTLLRKIYTDLYITHGGGWGVNEEHEIRQIERASWREAAQGRPIKCSDIIKHLSEKVSQLSKQAKQMSKQVKPIGIVLTKGVAGIGKTVSVQKFILDWAEGMSNQHVNFIFPLPFRELNLMKEKTISLVDLIRHFFSYVKDPRVFTSLENRVMFIFDGLDECRLPLDFRSNPECCDVTKSVPVDVLLTNLIKGNLLPFALLWITTRPAAANQIPLEYVSHVTEIRGFNDPQKEEYFRKKLNDKKMASRIIAHLKSCRSLFIMCHIPVFSWILATIVEKTSDGSGSVEMPRTLTHMYTHFLIIQAAVLSPVRAELVLYCLCPDLTLLKSHTAAAEGPRQIIITIITDCVIFSWVSSRLQAQGVELTLENPDTTSSSLDVSSPAGCHPDCKPWELRY